MSQGQRHGSKPGLAVQFDGHHGPVTAVSCHRATGGQTDLSHLFLTSSFDWTVKLWSTKLQNEQQLTVSLQSALVQTQAHGFSHRARPAHPCAPLRTTVTMCMMSSGAPLILLCLPASMGREGWISGISTLTLRLAFSTHRPCSYLPSSLPGTYTDGKPGCLSLQTALGSQRPLCCCGRL